MKKFVIADIILVLVIISLMFTGCSVVITDQTEEQNTIVVVPGIIECSGKIDIEYFGLSKRTKLPMLICNDGRVFHNITNYQIKN